MSKFIDITGKTINSWSVRQRVKKTKGRTHWLCTCKCGMDAIVDSNHLIGGKSKQCKTCHNKQAVLKRPLKHGGCKIKNSGAYISWISMKTRCLNANSGHWKNYGERGINICPTWENDFLQFYLDMGERPKGHTLERIDNQREYSKQNCKWATPKEQSQNKRNNIKLAFNNILKTKTDWAKEFGIPYTSFSRKIAKNGWPLPQPPEMK